MPPYTDRSVENLIQERLSVFARELPHLSGQGLFKVVVAAWCRVDTPWVRYKPGGHGGYRDRGGCLTSTADRSESCRARTRIFSHPGR